MIDKSTASTRGGAAFRHHAAQADAAAKPNLKRIVPGQCIKASPPVT